MIYVLRLAITFVILHNLFAGKVNKDVVVMIKPRKNALTKKQYLTKIRRLRRIYRKHNARNRRAMTPHIIVPAFYVGGFNNSRNSSTVIKSKCFTGIISNIEVIQTKNSFSDDLLQLIVDKQSVFNPWSKSTNNEEDKPPAPKRKKVT